ncbi:hypothetical protein EUX98_g6564 [Antrodiella citrinella]|uniref:Uncharacterized protein n=1 Tax=Antrodiella citrinella TaxID=2447956 RepID=A0A4S4MQH7_9APHY|nr:hypothetical protein EUX98_g6564 [Antrodiella citrinella]
MAYNRELDRGKDDGGSWSGNTWSSDYNTRGSVRGREEEQWGNGKRRKYNNGGYDPTVQYDESSYDNSYDQGYGGQGNRKDWGQGGGDPSQDRGFTKKRLVPSQPSPHVIFLGLDRSRSRFY